VLWDILVSIFWFMILFTWIWLLVMIFGDLFRDHELSGWGKALWVLFLLVMPWLGALVYLVARGRSMNERARQQAERDERPRFAMGALDRGDVDVVHAVAAQDDDRLVTVTQAILGSEHATCGAARRLLHDPVEADAVRAAVTDHSHEHVGQPRRIGDQVAVAVTSGEAKQVAEGRFVRDRQCGLWHHLGPRSESGSLACGHDEDGAHGSRTYPEMNEPAEASLRPARMISSYLA
jgi:hypothetical protein